MTTEQVFFDHLALSDTIDGWEYPDDWVFWDSHDETHILIPKSWTATVEIAAAIAQRITLERNAAEEHGIDIGRRDVARQMRTLLNVEEAKQ